MSENLRDPLPAKLLEEAAAWHLRISSEIDEQTRGEFLQWMASCSQNAAAFSAVQETFKLVQQTREDPALGALRRQTLARIAGPQKRFRGRRALAAAFALILAVPAAWIGHSLIEPLISKSPAPSQPFQSALGERRTIRLADGSEVTLNTDSAIQVSYSDNKRAIELQRGQALFKVAKDQRTPFTVTSGDRRITAHGTEFDVRRDGGILTVALLEGSVSVAPTQGSQGAPVRLRPNDVLTVRGDRVAVEREDVRDHVSWLDGLAIFRDQELSSAVAEMNRYGRVHIELADERSRRMLVSGTFNVGDPDGFAQALTEILPVEISRRTDDRIVLRGK